MEKKTKPKKNLEVKVEDMDQFAGCVEEIMNKKKDKYAPLIGSFLISFSDLEDTLEMAIADMIFDDAHEDGYTIIKKLISSVKIELFYDLALQRAACGKKADKKVSKLKLLKSKLDKLNTLRNKIVHAKWYTLDKEGYVRVDITTNKEDGMIAFKRFKLTPPIIRQGIKNAEETAESLNNFTENLWQ